MKQNRMYKPSQHPGGQQSRRIEPEYRPYSDRLMNHHRTCKRRGGEKRLRRNGQKPAKVLGTGGCLQACRPRRRRRRRIHEAMAPINGRKHAETNEATRRRMDQKNESATICSATGRGEPKLHAVGCSCTLMKHNRSNSDAVAVAVAVVVVVVVAAVAVVVVVVV